MSDAIHWQLKNLFCAKEWLCTCKYQGCVSMSLTGDPLYTAQQKYNSVEQKNVVRVIVSLM